MNWKERLIPFRNWVIRVRVYSERGLYWMPAMDFIFAVWGIVTYGLWGILFYVLLRGAVAPIIGYIDVNHVKSFQYQSEFQTRLNPFFTDWRREQEVRK